jgi:hypothetical protein
MRVVRTSLHASILCIALVSASVARAESAADKATAREVATEGIGLYKEGKYADALDRLRRAQELYDAPVHLLYIARAQEKLGQLVEASENYRLLDHYTLPHNAPDAWVSAVEDGRKELAELEPRIPKLRVVSDPENLPSPALTIDGAEVSAAVIGIARPANPGKHHVVLSAQGYAKAEADVELAEKDEKDVSLTLAPAPATAASPAADGAASATSDKATSSDDDKPSSIGFLLGLRLGVGVPTGTLFHPIGVAGIPSKDLQTSELFGTGGTGELHVGLRVGYYFTPVFYVSGQSLSPGKGTAQITDVKGTKAGEMGLGLIVGSAPNRLGGFGELDFVLSSSFTATGKVLNGPDCTFTASGGALRFGGGAVFPVSTWLHVTPVATATIGRFTTIDSKCLIQRSELTDAEKRTHGLIMIGIGGDWVLGGSRGK